MRSRTVTIVAVATLALVVLAGCGGIPSGGPVQSGQFIDEEDVIDVGYAPGGPQPGEDQQAILQGFINAATNPADNYAVARQFLAESIRDEWDPDALTQIRTGAGVPRKDSETAGTYTLTSSAYVNDKGQYVNDDEPTSQIQQFGFEQDAAGEWRISSAPPGIVLSQASFASIFGARSLYFFDPSDKYLIPDLRWFPRTNLLATNVVKALLGGPSDWLQQGVTNTYFPTGTTLDSSVRIDSGVATVALSDQALEASAEQLDRMRQQLRDTIGDVSNVVITVNGVELDASSTLQPATINPSVENQLLVRRDDTVGFLSTTATVSGFGGQADELVKLGATDFTLSADSSRSAMLGPDGVYLVFTAAPSALRVDGRAGLVAPTIDTAGFVWTVPAANAADIQAHDAEDGHFAISAPQLAGMQAVSFSVSRDGARALILASTELGPRLAVAGIIRAGGVPTQLGPLVWLPIAQSSRPLDATWVDDNAVATLSVLSGEDASTVTMYEIGGPSKAIGAVTGGVAIVGGNDGKAGLRVLTSEGAIYRSRGTGWADFGTTVTFIATQQ